MSEYSSDCYEGGQRFVEGTQAVHVQARQSQAARCKARDWTGTSLGDNSTHSESYGVDLLLRSHSHAPIAPRDEALLCDLSQIL